MKDIENYATLDNYPAKPKHTNSRILHPSSLAGTLLRSVPPLRREPALS